MRTERLRLQLVALGADIVKETGARSVVKVDAHAWRILHTRHQALIGVISVLIQSTVKQVRAAERFYNHQIYRQSLCRNSYFSKQWCCHC